MLIVRASEQIHGGIVHCLCMPSTWTQYLADCAVCICSEFSKNWFFLLFYSSYIIVIKNYSQVTNFCQFVACKLVKMLMLWLHQDIIFNLFLVFQQVAAMVDGLVKLKVCRQRKWQRKAAKMACILSSTCSCLLNCKTLDTVSSTCSFGWVQKHWNIF